MSNLTSPLASDSLADHPELFWSDFKQVISTSSGFKRWVLERGLDIHAQGETLDQLIQSYLKKTLETLAY
ncbi:MAG: hypothetical protein HC934_13225 [Acaryochloridaceae cyanobacterium SU_2_1]|nr:hypothetical protein [Acaryochloridaceae cyanobacterium SU_2_1]